MLNSIKKYLKRAKEEVTKDYSITSSPRQSDTIAVNGEIRRLPRAWTGVDLDGTLAYHDQSLAYDKIGEPVPIMLDLVKKMVNNGIRVKIFTARATDSEQLVIIRRWLKANGLPELEITNVKDYSMIRLYDDRCIQVEHNTGRLVVDK
ncbi:MAG: hypothetical protein L3J69_09655 [Desulfobacula sp.]|nr:hypothetical protein [Desulfobacula sp.]